MDYAYLSTIANVAEILGATSIVGGVTFAIVQVRHYPSMQRDAVAANLMQTFYSCEFADKFSLIQQIPDDTGLEQMRAMGAEYYRAATLVTTSFETMGLLVYRRITPFDLVNELAGGVIVVMADKLQRCLAELRIEQNQPSWGEWFEWLADRLRDNAGDGDSKEPAYVRFANWRP